MRSDPRNHARFSPEEPWRPILVTALISGTILASGPLVDDSPFLFWSLSEFFWWLVSLPPWSPGAAAIAFLIGYRRWLSHPDSGATERAARVLAAISLIPTIPISLCASLEVPILIGLLGRLDNPDWQREITLALAALIAVASSLPGLVSRTLGKRWGDARVIWFPPIGAFALLASYAATSHHFNAEPRFVIASFSLLAVAVAWLGYRTDRALG